MQGAAAVGMAQVALVELVAVEQGLHLVMVQMEPPIRAVVVVAVAVVTEMVVQAALVLLLFVTQAHSVVRVVR
jgi:hypothetical protein